MAIRRRSPKLLACYAVALLLALTVARDPLASAYIHWHMPSTAAAISTVAAPARVLAGADVRSGPGERYLVLTQPQAAEEHTILGRSIDGRWLRINYRGMPAWVAMAQVETQATEVPAVRIGGEPL